MFAVHFVGPSTKDLGLEDIFSKAMIFLQLETLLIFPKGPLQVGEVERCSPCESLFHKPCFRKLTNCHCGAYLRVEESKSYRASGEVSRALDLLGKRSNSRLYVGLFSGLFARAKPDTTREHKHSDNVILMGSMPSTSV